MRAPAPGTISAVARAIPTARAATSADAGDARYQAARLPSSHSWANVVLPYPAGATSRTIRAPLSSSMRVSRGRLIMRRRLTPAAGVAVPVIPRRRNRNRGGTKYRLVERGPVPAPGRRYRAVSPRMRRLRIRGFARAGRRRLEADKRLESDAVG